MSVQDRRSGIKRRVTNRFTLSIDVEWEITAGRFPGTISDVSLEGCFILSSGDVEDGEIARVFVPIADGMKVQYDGKIANHVFEIGFGVKFDQLSAAQRELLVKVVRASEAV